LCDRAPRPQPGGSPVRVASVGLPLPKSDEPPLPDWFVRAFPEDWELE